MELDRARLAEVLSADYSYYEGPSPQCHIDARMNPDTGEFIGAQLRPDMRVLDVGCGNGTTLLRSARGSAMESGSTTTGRISP